MQLLAEAAGNPAPDFPPQDVERLRRNLKLGADHVLNLQTMPEVADRIAWERDLTGGRGADVV